MDDYYLIVLAAERLLNFVHFLPVFVSLGERYVSRTIKKGIDEYR